MNANTEMACETTGKLLTRHWWVLALRGLAAIAFGVLAFVWPHITLFTLVLLFGIYAILNGVLSFVLAARTSREFPRFTGLILPGLLSIAAGLIAFFLPKITALALVIVIAAWFIVTGIWEIVQAVRLRNEVSNEWLLILAGLAGVVFGLFVFFRPGAGALALVWWIGTIAIFFGLMLIVTAFRLRHWKNLMPGFSAHA